MNKKLPVPTQEAIYYFILDRIEYNYFKRTLRISTKEKVRPQDFDSVKQIVKKSCQQCGEMNDQIFVVKRQIDTIIRYARINNIEPTIDYVSKNYYKNTEETQKPSIPQKSFFQLMEEWIEYSKNQKRSQKGTRLKSNTLKNYKTLISHLKIYSNSKNIVLDGHIFCQKFYEAYTSFLQDEFENVNCQGLSSNSIANDIKLLKIFLRWMEEQGLPVCQDYKDFRIKWKAIEIIVLDWKEITQIMAHDIENQSLARIRDILIVGCSTGLRISDLLSLKQSNIDIVKKEIRLTTIKTEQTLTIPILDFALPVLEKYISNNSLKLFNISSQKFNDYLKELGKKTGINTPITRITYQNSKRVDITVPKYELMTSHICRRTYITELLKRKVSAEIVMQASGHVDYKSFRKYIKLASDDVKSQILDAFKSQKTN